MLRLVLTAFFAITTDGGGRPDAVEPTIFFERLTAAEARWLQGEWITCRIRIDSLPGEHNGHTLYDCVGFDDNHRTLWFVGEPEIDETRPLTVPSRLSVIRLKPTIIGETAFEAYTEFRLFDASRAGAHCNGSR